jgi:hypothetical protein
MGEAEVKIELKSNLLKKTQKHCDKEKKKKEE